MKCKSLFDKVSALSQRHLLRKHSDTAKSLTAVLCLLCHRKDFSVRKLQIIRAQFSHTKYIIVGVHGIIGNIIPDQTHNFSSGRVIIINPLDSAKDHRMMRDDHICTFLHCLLKRFLCQVQCEKDMKNTLLIISDQKSDVVPVLCRLCRIFMIQPCCQFLNFHNDSGQPG